MNIFKKKKIIEKKSVKKYNMNFNLNSIIKWEYLNNKSFNKIDYNNEDDLISLIYCILICSNNITYTFEVFKEVYKNEQETIIPLISSFKNNYEFLNQFKPIEKENNEVKEVNDDIKEEVYFKDLVSILIVNGGIDIEYVLNKMNVNDILLFITHINNKIHSEIEFNRLWTYLSMLPHVDGKTLDNPKKLIEFEWEKSENKEEEYININIEDKLKQGEEIYKKINNIE